MIKIMIAESQIPSFDEMLKIEVDRKAEREKVIAPRVARITERGIDEIIKGLQKRSVGTFDIEKNDGGFCWEDKDAMTYEELIELAESLASLFKSKGYKSSIMSFSSGYKVLRRVTVKLR